MPLIKNVLKSGLEAKIENALKAEINKPAVAKALRKALDGSPLKGAPSGASNFSSALSNVSNKAKGLSAGVSSIPGSEVGIIVATQKLTANEFANAITKGTIKWMNDEWIPIMAKVIAEAVASEVDTFVKSATVVVNPGQAVAAPGGAGTTTSPGTGTIK